MKQKKQAHEIKSMPDPKEDTKKKIATALKATVSTKKAELTAESEGKIAVEVSKSKLKGDALKVGKKSFSRSGLNQVLF